MVHSVCSCRDTHERQRRSKQVVGEPAVLVGNSLGGYAAMATAASHPDLVSTLQQHTELRQASLLCAQIGSFAGAVTVCRRLLLARPCMHRIAALRMQSQVAAGLARWVGW